MLVEEDYITAEIRRTTKNKKDRNKYSHKT